MGNEQYDTLLLETIKRIEKKIDSQEQRVGEIEKRLENGLYEKMQHVESTVNKIWDEQQRQRTEIDAMKHEREHRHDAEEKKAERKKRAWYIVKVVLSVAISAGLLVVAVIGL
jgi:exonuclease VII large subunit